MSSKMRILSWNVNGLRSIVPANGSTKEILKSLNADIVCLQETKLAGRSQTASDLACVDGWEAFFSFASRGGYSGVVTYARSPTFLPIASADGLTGVNGNRHKRKADELPDSLLNDTIESAPDFLTNVMEALGIDQRRLIALDSEGRAVVTEHQCASPTAGGADPISLFLINVYCPRAGADSADRQEFKQQYSALLQMRAEELSTRGHVIIVGDLNACHRPMDTADADHRDFSDHAARKWLDEFVAPSYCPRSSIGAAAPRRQLIDVFRNYHPLRRHAYTCWSTTSGGRANNCGI